MTRARGTCAADPSGRRSVLVVSGAVAAAVVTLAGEARTQPAYGPGLKPAYYADATRDVSVAPDVLHVAVIGDQPPPGKAGHVSFSVTLFNRPSGLRADDALEISFDVDRKRTTGAPPLGADRVFRWEAARATGVSDGSGVVFRWDVGRGELVETPSNGWRTRAPSSPNELSFEFRTSGLRLQSGKHLLFAVRSEAAAGAAREYDYVPDRAAGPTGIQLSSYRYDVRGPTVEVISVTAAGRRGALFRLGYRVSDDSSPQWTQEYAEIYRSAKQRTTGPSDPLVRLRPTRMRATSRTRAYAFSWRIPPRFPRGAYSFCVTARDDYDNSGPKRCARLVVR